MNYEPQIRNYIKPNLGDVPLLLLVRDASERLETFYARLRRLPPPLFREVVYRAQGRGVACGQVDQLGWGRSLNATVSTQPPRHPPIQPPPRRSEAQPL